MKVFCCLLSNVAAFELVSDASMAFIGWNLIGRVDGCVVLAQDRGIPAASDSRFAGFIIFMDVVFVPKDGPAVFVSSVQDNEHTVVTFGVHVVSAF